jgi:hypothetical protein
MTMRSHPRICAVAIMASAGWLSRACTVSNLTLAARALSAAAASTFAACVSAIFRNSSMGFDLLPENWTDNAITSNWITSWGQANQVKRLKELEAENTRLRRAVSDLTLEKLILKEAASGNF